MSIFFLSAVSQALFPALRSWPCAGPGHCGKQDPCHKHWPAKPLPCFPLHGHSENRVLQGNFLTPRQNSMFRTWGRKTSNWSSWLTFFWVAGCPIPTRVLIAHKKHTKWNSSALNQYVGLASPAPTFRFGLGFFREGLFFTSKLLNFCWGAKAKRSLQKHFEMRGGWPALETEKDTMTPTSVYRDPHSLTGPLGTLPKPSHCPAAQPSHGQEMGGVRHQCNPADWLGLQGALQ